MEPVLDKCHGGVPQQNYEKQWKERIAHFMYFVKVNIFKFLNIELKK